MCGRYLLLSDFEMLALRYGVDENKVDYKLGEVFPSDIVPIIKEDNNKKIIEKMRWGFYLTNKNPIINAKSETVFEKSLFKSSVCTRRCIIPATSFFEWQKNGQLKIKYNISIKNQSTFSIAGIYNTFLDSEGSIFNGFVILTTSPNTIMSEIHDRMPVILHKEDENIWLSNRISNINSLKCLFNSYENNELMVKAL